MQRHRYKQILQKQQEIFSRFDKTAPAYTLSLENIQVMSSQVLCRQKQLVGISNADPKLISKYFTKYKILFFNEASFDDMKRFGGAKIAFNLGKMYVGSIVQGQRHGKGVIVCPKGKVYEGAMIDNERNGKGVQIYQNGNFYYGEFLDNKRHGHGTIVWLDPAQQELEHKYQYYKGQWREGEPCGYGLHYSNGNTYLGFFKNGVKHGKGVEITQEGSIFEGTFINGRKQGKGFYFLSDVYFYQGQYKNGLKHGYGKQGNLITGQQYEGFYQVDRKEGIGLLQRQNQFYYRGMFTQDQPNGNGEFVKYQTKKAKSASKDKNNNCKKNIKGSRTLNLRQQVELRSAQLQKQKLRPRKQSERLPSKPVVADSRVRDKSVSLGKWKWKSAVREHTEQKQPTYSEVVLDDKKCRYKSCSCSKFEEKSSSRVDVNEARLKRMFSSRKVIMKQVA